MRAKQLDDWSTDFLRRHPNAVVLHLGCGMDTRAFRLHPPETVQWFDVDQPDVIAFRRKLYIHLTIDSWFGGTSAVRRHCVNGVTPPRPNGRG
jgi:O-methyltransferase involved in polyketide biosynthesis